MKPNQQNNDSAQNPNQYYANYQYPGQHGQQNYHPPQFYPYPPQYHPPMMGNQMMQIPPPLFSQNSTNKLEKPQRKLEDPRKRKQAKIEEKEDFRRDDEDESDSQNSSEDEEQVYLRKSKQIQKKRDPVLDSPEEIRKWIEARKKNYPSANRKDRENIAGELSLLEKRIRKKLVLLTSDGKGLLKKIRNMDILRRIITNPQPINKRKKKVNKRPIRKVEVEKNEVQKEGNHEENSQNSEPVEKPIERKPIEHIQEQRPRVSSLQPEQIIKHLQEKQIEDKEFYSSLMNYKENSLNYKYTYKTLETNFVLEDVFEESCYLLQAIRYIVKNDFFNE